MGKPWLRTVALATMLLVAPLALAGTSKPTAKASGVHASKNGVAGKGVIKTQLPPKKNPHLVVAK